MEILFELLGEVLTTVLITKSGRYFLLFLIVLGGIVGYTYYIN